MSLQAAFDDVSAGIDRAFDALLEIPPDARGRLYEAMRYAAIGGGKRIRPLLVIAACDLFNVDRERALRVALATGTPLLLALTPARSASARVAPDTVPASLRAIDVTSGCAADYDARLLGGAA